MNNTNFEDLKNKTCAITGGGGVIGTAIAEALALAGVKVAILDIVREAATKVADDLYKRTGTPCIGVIANVLEKSSMERARKEIHEKLGPIDFLINGAGGNSPKATTKIEQITEDNKNDLSGSFYGLELEGFDKVFDLNFKGTLIPSLVLTQDMIERGKGVILNISSMNAYKPLTKIPAYSAAKASINNFTEWLAVHFAKAGIRANAIAPGFFLTNQNRFLLVDEKTGNLTPRGQKIIDNTPMGKYGEPEDLQGAVLFLLSEISSFITGVCIPIDGGFNAFSGV